MRVVPLLLILCAVAACDRVVVKPVVDAGPVCAEGENLVQGACRFVCNRDGECPTGQRCNLLLGSCEPRVDVPDSGTPPIPCTRGAVRCSVDNLALQTCSDEGVFETSEICTTPDGYCENERCLACRPGARRCVGVGTEICADDGSAWRAVTCAANATCVAGECVECTIGQRRCSASGTTLEECQRLPREDLSAGYVPAGDNFDGTCVTQVCETGANGPQCRTPACLPGATQCASATTQQTCTAVGAWADTVCTSLPDMGPTAQCISGTCIDECGDAARAKSYFGCEYWTAVMDNVVTPSIFKGNQSAAGQGTNDSEFAFVVANNSVLPTTLTVNRYVGSAVQTVKTVNVPGRNDPATRGIAQVRVPWHVLSPTTGSQGVSGRARYAYRLTTNRPVTVYQFNPLGASARYGTCSNVNQCTAMPSGYGQTCTANQCTYFGYSNDASLLLPAHILGTSYVGLTPETVIRRAGSATGTPTGNMNGTLVIVSPQDNTQVTVRANARTLAGVGGVTAMAAGESRTFTLASYEVLQLSSDVPAGMASGSTTGNLQCANDPYDQFGCALGCDRLCRVANGDLTGSIITADKPIAVFGGSACTLRGYADAACDHVEEQLFPFVTWGKNFIGARTAPLRLTDNNFASAANAGPDYYKIVAGCPDSACPNGTTVNLSVLPAAADVLSGGGCEPGTALTNASAPCRLRGGRFIEFRSKTSFRISADQPIQVSQTFAGQEATTGTVRPVQGDPSQILLPPVEQWRASYTVLTAPGTRDNYLGIVVDDARVQEVRVDGAVVPSAWATIGGTTFKVTNMPVQTGSHTIQVVARQGQTEVPGAGVTVYGFDDYVSYGYTGGLDLTTIVTGVNPGG